MKSETLQVRASRATKDRLLIEIARKETPSGAAKMVTALSHWYTKDDARDCRALAIIRRDDPTLFEKLIRKDTEEKEMVFGPLNTEPERYRYCPSMECNCSEKFPTNYILCPKCGVRLLLKVPPIPKDNVTLPEAHKGVKESIINELKPLIVDEFKDDNPGLTETKVTEDALLVNDLGANSLTELTLLQAIEEKFDFDSTPDELLDRVRTVGDLADLVIHMTGKTITGSTTTA